MNPDQALKPRIEQIPDAALYAIAVVYFATLGLSFGFPQPFFVLRPSGVLLIAAISTLPLIVATHLASKKQHGALIAAVHIYAAVLFHPQVSFSQPVYMDEAEQLATLLDFQLGVLDLSVENDMAYHLAHALKSESASRFEAEHPVLTWLFPPSVVLVAWALIFFWLFRPRASPRVAGT